MIQDSTANRLTDESGLKVEFDRGHHRARGYWVVDGAFLGVDSGTARRSLASIKALNALAAELEAEVAG